VRSRRSGSKDNGSQAAKNKHGQSSSQSHSPAFRCASPPNGRPVSCHLLSRDSVMRAIHAQRHAAQGSPSNPAVTCVVVVSTLGMDAGPDEQTNRQLPLLSPRGHHSPCGDWRLRTSHLPNVRRWLQEDAGRRDRGLDDSSAPKRSFARSLARAASSRLPTMQGRGGGISTRGNQSLPDA